MDDKLKANISSDMFDLDTEEQGAVTMFHLIIERMVVRNQEEHDSIVAYLAVLIFVSSMASASTRRSSASKPSPAL